MKLLSALVVDEIRDTEDGTVDLLGLREDLFFDSVPVVLERLTLFLEMEVEPSDRGVRHHLELRVVDPSGAVIGGTPLRFTLPADYPRPTAPLDPTIFEITFGRFGAHHIEILLAGELVRRLHLHVYPRETTDA